MRRMGGVSTGARDRAGGTLKGLQGSDSSAQYAALNELCEMLNTGTEDTLASLRPDSYIPAVVNIMQNCPVAETKLLATRAITYFVDAIPGCTNVVAAAGGIDTLTSFLLEIQDITLAEQALIGLDKISRENPACLLNARGPEAFLLFVDFFAIHIQRNALSSVARLAQRASANTFHRFAPILSALHQRILHEDRHVAESALTCLSRLVQSVRGDSVKITAIISPEAVPAFVEALEGKQVALASKVLAEGAQVPEVASTLIDYGIVTVVSTLLGGKLVRATPQATPQQTPQFGATASPTSSIKENQSGGVSNQNQNQNENESELSPLQLQDSASGTTTNTNAAAASSGETTTTASSTTAAAVVDIRPETALDLVTIVLRLLPEVRTDYMLYVTEGCKFYERPGLNAANQNQNVGLGGGGRGGGGNRRPGDMLQRLMGLPADMPAELRAQLQAMLEAAGAMPEGGGEGEGEDEGEGDEGEEEEAATNNNTRDIVFDDDDFDEDDDDEYNDDDDDDDDDDEEEEEEHDDDEVIGTDDDEDDVISSDDDDEEGGAHHHHRNRRIRHRNTNNENNHNHHNNHAAAENGPFTDDRIQELCRGQNITLVQDVRWARCRIPHHSCDRCGEGSLQYNNWFRSNERPDYDLCRRCFVNALRHRGVRPQHGSTFTDMNSFSTAHRLNASGSGSSAPPLQPLTRAEDPRIKMLEESPYIIPRVAEGINAIVKYRLGSEDVQLQARVLDLICRLTEHLDGDEIRHFFWDVPLTILLARTLSTNNNASDQNFVVGQHVVSLYICKTLLEKMKDTIVPYFFRNGLSRALSVRSAQAGAAVPVPAISDKKHTAASASSSSASKNNNNTATTETKQLTLQEQMLNLKNRKVFVGTLARKLNQEYFANAPGSDAFDDFAEAAKGLLTQTAKHIDAAITATTADSPTKKATAAAIAAAAVKATTSSSSSSSTKTKAEKAEKTGTTTTPLPDPNYVWDSAMKQLLTRFSSNEDDAEGPPLVSAHEMDDSGMLEGLVKWLQQAANSDVTTLSASSVSSSETTTTNNNNNNNNNNVINNKLPTFVDGVVAAVQLVTSLYQATGSNNVNAGKIGGVTPPHSPNFTATASPPPSPGSESKMKNLATAAVEAEAAKSITDNANTTTTNQTTTNNVSADSASNSPSRTTDQQNQGSNLNTSFSLSNSAYTSPASPSSHQQHQTTALHRLVSVLQDIVADSEKFDPSNVNMTRRRSDGLELKLTREGPMTLSSTSPTSPENQSSRPSSSSAYRSSAKEDRNKELNVSIDRQASVGAIEDYLRGSYFNLATAAANRRRAAAQQQQNQNEDNNNEDNVEEILPQNIISSDSSSSSSSLPLVSGRGRGGGGNQNQQQRESADSSNTGGMERVQPIYIRIGNTILSSHFSMNEVIAKHNIATATATASGGVGSLEQQAKLHFHFSLEPFKNLDQDSSSLEEGEKSTGGVGRQLYDKNMTNRIFLEFRKALTGKLHVAEEAGVSVNVLLATRLLRVINIVNGNLTSLRCYIRMNAGTQLPCSSPEKASLLTFAAGSDEEGPGIRFQSQDMRSRRLTSKVEKVISSNSCVGNLRESWCVAIAIDCPFLLPLDTRLTILELGFLGQTRGLARHAERLQHLQGGSNANNANNTTQAIGGGLGFLVRAAGGGMPRVPRKKFRVWRDDKVLECATELFKRGPDAGTESALEFEFYGEVGSGLGPTLEFYSLACEALQRRELDLFRSESSSDGDDNTSNSFVISRNGLFFSLFGNELHARTLGGLLCRSLMDRRVANIYLSPALIRLLRGEVLVFDDIVDILSVSAVNSLLDIYAASHNKKGELPPKNSNNNMYNGNVNDLCLSFDLQNFIPLDKPNIELCPGGSEKDVTGENCKEYCELTVEKLLSGEKIRSLISECRVSMVTLFDTRAFKLFEPYELSSLWKGLDQVTTFAEFAKHTLFDHGYTSTHPTAKMLLEVLSELNAEDQRAFFRFLTGSPSLPVGGLAQIRPRFTVVRRVGENEQLQLPTAMTCQNFLKLPAYNTKAILKEKLMQAVYEGAGSFLFT